jgi:EAL domain-containing protein (putative c-di-GMP-specific phosphodiesterase class I)/PleD family two-component response regulator/PAS domain-containing protein
MVDTSIFPSVTFRCLEDEFWTIAEGSERLSSFLNCTHEQFMKRFNNSFVPILDPPEKPLFDTLQLSLIEGKMTTCSVVKDESGLKVRLDALPVERLLSATSYMKVGLFQLSSNSKIQNANENFYRLIGYSEEAFVRKYENDLISLTGPLTKNTLETVSLGFPEEEKRVLFFSVGETAGFCMEIDADIHDELQLYRQSLAQNGYLVWEYDLAKKQVLGHEFKSDDLETLRPLHERLEDGELSCQETVFLSNGDSNSTCYHIRYTKKKDKALAIALDLSGIPSACRSTFFEDQFSASRHKDLLTLVKANLSHDHLIKLQQHGIDLVQGTLPETYSQWVKQNSASMVSEEDKKKFEETFSLEGLLKAVSDGKNSVFMEFRKRDEFGVIRWLEHRTMLTYEPESKNVYAVGIAKYITEKKKFELGLEEKAIRDKDSGFYDRNTSAMMISYALKNVLDAKSSYVFAMIDIKGLRQVSSPVKHSLVPHLAQLLRMGIHDRCIIGRYDSSRFLVFFGEVDSISQVRHRLEEISRMISNAYLFVPVSMTFWSNIGFMSGKYGEMAQYQELLEKAFLALDKANEKGRNQVVSYNLEKGIFPATVYQSSNSLDENAQGVLLGCMDATLSSENLDSTLPLVLSQLGMYYKARRVCLLTQEKSGMLEISASWEIAGSKHSVGLFETDPFENIPTVQELVYLEKDDFSLSVPCFAGSSLSLGRLKVWGMEKGYLVVVDPNTSDLSVLGHSLQLISSEMTKRRLLDRQEYLVYHDPITGLLNYNGYTQYTSTLREDSLSSLGLVLVDINNLREMNKNLGKEYGNEIVSLVSVKIQSLFPDCSWFRISGDEFVIICQDLTYESFNKRVATFSADIEKEKPNAVLVGQAWSENDMHVSVLFSQANIVLDARRQNTLDRSSRQADFHLAINALVEAINRGEYVVFLQPKVNSLSSKVCGAEALIRKLDPKLGVVSPSRFIAQMEKDGLVKFIDLFVFRQVCQTIRHWMDEGTPLLPISLNFSRVTLLDEDLIPSMLRIKDEYQVDSKYVEIEITESFGALERNLVKKVVQAISDAGFCICIDDFGSEYSNLSTLTSLPLGILKLDKSLIDNLCTSTNSQVFVDGFISICRKLGILTVAEGVETENQRNLVIEMGCDMIQGYFYDKPISIGSFEQKYMAEK